MANKTSARPPSIHPCQPSDIFLPQRDGVFRWGGGVCVCVCGERCLCNREEGYWAASGWWLVCVGGVVEGTVDV